MTHWCALMYAPILTYMDASQRTAGAWVGLKEAAQLTGRDTSTITRAANKGRLSCRKGTSGRREYDVAELEREYGPLTTSDGARTGAKTVQRTVMHDALQRVHDAEKAAMQREIEVMKERQGELKNQMDDLRTDRNHWREQAELHTRLLADMREQAEKDAEAAQKAQEVLEEKRRGFWRRLFGG